MSKTSQGSGSAGGGSLPPVTPDRPQKSTSPSSTSRASARRTAPPSPSGGTGSVFERYRSVLLVGGAAVVIGLVALFVLQSSGPTYACDSLLTPGPSMAAPGVASSPAPSASPVPEPTQRLGFVTRDLGRGHVATSSTIDYAFCPPTSGSHYSSAGLSPLRRDFYDPGDRVTPGSWIHNLEHGYVVIAYKGEPDKATLDEIRGVMDSVPPSDIATQCGLPNKVIAVRFDDMSEPYATLSWNVALLMSDFDPAAARTFAEQWQDPAQTPEQSC